MPGEQPPENTFQEEGVKGSGTAQGLRCSWCSLSPSMRE